MALHRCQLLPFSLSCHTQLFVHVRNLITAESVPIITAPVSWTKKTIKRQNAINKQKQEEKACKERQKLKVCFFVKYVFKHLDTDLCLFQFTL